MFQTKCEDRKSVVRVLFFFCWARELKLSSTRDLPYKNECDLSYYIHMTYNIKMHVT